MVASPDQRLVALSQQ